MTAVTLPLSKSAYTFFLCSVRAIVARGGILFEFGATLVGRAARPVASRLGVVPPIAEISRMASAAILVGNTEYRNLLRLECCGDDLCAVRQLLQATEKYAEITVIENAGADDLKLRLRAAIDKVKSPDELFFYYTGHGHLREDDFFHCATNFDSSRPNETGLSTTELHTLLRLADASLVVKVIDACSSGTLLIKSEADWFQQTKGGFKNLIQIASCLDSQDSLTGNPLSLFTAKFRDAALRKTDGIIFYTDIINTLRDEFMQNNAQTPFFVSQHTGREQFVDDATKLEALRKDLDQARAERASLIQVEQQNAPEPLSLLERLRIADAKVVTPELMARFVKTFFDDLIKKVSGGKFAEFFDLERMEYAGFEEQTTRRFIIRVMSNEKRTDNFVTAVHERKLRRTNPLFGAVAALYLNDDAYEETWTLRLNCAMERTELRITLTPKYTNLQRIVLVTTCAPSLDHCYIFEATTQHMLSDFGKYDTYGDELSRRWWKVPWVSSTKSIVDQISMKLTEAAEGQLESAEKRLSQS